MHYLTGTTGTQQNLTEISGFTLLETELAACTEVPTHTHENATIVLTLSGDYRESYRGASSWHPPLTIIAKPAGERHANRVGEHAARCLVVELGETRIQEFSRVGVIWDCPMMHNHGSGVSAALRIVRELRSPDSVSALILEGATLELAASISRMQLPVYSNEPKWMREVIEVIHCQPVEALRLARIARIAGVHPVHLARTFRLVNGCSLGTYVRRVQVTRAIALLSQPEISLGGIAAAAGFYDQSHMGRLIRSATGMSPLKLRTILTS